MLTYLGMAKQITLTESELRRIIAESIKSVLNESYDFNEIGQIDYNCSFDKDEYVEWLEYEGLSESKETLLRYFKEEIQYNIELFDSETYHHMDWQSLYYDEIVGEYNEKIADEIVSDCIKYGKGSLEISSFISEYIDIHNPEELNAEAMKLLKHGNYFKGARGYILTNGVMIYTEAEHNMVSIINGIKGTFHFMSLGNIRVLPNSIDIASKPTRQQEIALMRIIKTYSQDTLYIDFITPNGETSKTYNKPNYEMVMNDINRVFGVS